MSIENGIQATPTRPKTSDTTIVVVLLLATLACYGNILTNSFVYDDDQQILQNPYVKSWHFLPQIFGTTVWSFVGQAGTTNYYRPLMTFTFLVLWQLFGPIPFGFHLFSLVAQCAVVIVMFYAGRRLFQDRSIAFVAALIFALHPIHTEAVDWIAAVPDLEAAFFLLLALWLYADTEKLDSKIRLGVALCFVLALLCKEPALMFAPLLVAFEHGVRPERRETNFTQKLLRYAPVCLLGIAYLGLRILLFGKLAPVLQRPKLTWPETIYSAFALVWDYTKLLVWPTPLSAFHVFQASHSFSEGRVLCGLLVVCLSLITLAVLHKKSPQAAFSILWIGVTLAPVLNARWMAANVLTERYLYLPSVGFCWFVAWSLVHAWRATKNVNGLAVLRWAGTGALCLLTVLALWSTVKRNRYWETDLILYTRTLETDPEAFIIRGNLAGIYFDRRDYALAEENWKITLAGKPDSVNTMNGLGILYTKQGRYTEAESQLRHVIALKPLWAEGHYNLGVLLGKTGDKVQALSELKQAVELAPLNPAARQFYAEQLADCGNFLEAETQFKKSIELDPSLDALQGLATLYVKIGQPGLAEQTLRRLLSESPMDGASHLELAKILEASGRKEEAKREFRLVLETDAGNSEAQAALKRLQ